MVIKHAIHSCVCLSKVFNDVFPSPPIIQSVHLVSEKKKIRFHFSFDADLWCHFFRKSIWSLLTFFALQFYFNLFNFFSSFRFDHRFLEKYLKKRVFHIEQTNITKWPSIMFRECRIGFSMTISYGPDANPTCKKAFFSQFFIASFGR